MEEVKRAQPEAKTQTLTTDTNGESKAVVIGDGQHGTGSSITKTVVDTEFVIQEMPDLSKLDDLKPGKSHVAKYRTQEDWAILQAQPIRCFYLGIKEIPNDQGEMIKAAVFVEKLGIFLVSQMVLLDAVRHMVTMSPVIITYMGKKKNKSSAGSTNLFDVVELIK